MRIASRTGIDRIDMIYRIRESLKNVFPDRRHAPEGPNPGPGSRRILISLDSGFHRSDEFGVV
jgi:hypothetical protein